MPWPFPPGPIFCIKNLYWVGHALLRRGGPTWNPPSWMLEVAHPSRPSMPGCLQLHSLSSLAGTTQTQSWPCQAQNLSATKEEGPAAGWDTSVPFCNLNIATGWSWWLELPPKVPWETACHCQPPHLHLLFQTLQWQGHKQSCAGATALWWTVPWPTQIWHQITLGSTHKHWRNIFKSALNKNITFIQTALNLIQGPLI